MAVEPVGHVSLEVKEDPPPFIPYTAEFTHDSNGNIITHDSHLNQDGEALYRFILEQSESSPAYSVLINGTHTERRSRTVSSYVNGRRTTRTEHYTVTITDFMFGIDLTDYFVHGPTHFTYPDDVATYRGLLVRQVITPQGTHRKATDQENAAFKMDERAHSNTGLPPWSSLDGSRRSKNEASAFTVREWADHYAASTKILKEFIYEKTIYGWNTAKLHDAIETAIRQTGYSSSITISFNLSAKKICIRADNRLSRTLSRTLYKVLLIIFLIYPFIWLFKRFSRYGGGKWEVCGGAYGLVTTEPLSDSDDLSDLITGEEAKKPSLRPRAIQVEGSGLRKITGYREGEWFREWEPVIKRCVSNRVKQDGLFKHVDQGPGDPAAELDGYVQE